MNRLQYMAASVVMALCLGGVHAKETTVVEIDPLKVETLQRGSTMEEKALEYLSKRGEVILRISLPTVEAIDEIALIGSIDKVLTLKDLVVYFNAEGFAAFQKLNYDYVVLVPESMQIPKSRGDNNYRNFNSRDDISTFPSYDGYVNIMQGFASSAPEICRLKEVGSSVNGRKILFAVLSDNVNENEAEPKVTYTSTMHGDETVGMILYLKLIQYLINNYNSDAEAKEIVDNMELWVCPDLNPDGTYDASNGQGQWGATRKNAKNIDINRCFPDVTQPNGTSFSQAPELAAVVDLDREKKFYIGADSHGGMEGLVMPWAYQKGIPAPANKKVWQRLGNVFMSSMDQIFVCENGPYAAPGTKFDFGYYEYSGVVICPELSRTKPIQEGQFDYQWNRFKQGYIDLLKEAMYGIHGTIVDYVTGEPVPSTIEVSLLDDDGYGMVETHKLGDFYHTATTGTYTVTIKPENQVQYNDTTISGIQVTTGKQTRLDVRIVDKNTSVTKNVAVKENTFAITKLASGAHNVQFSLKGNVQQATLFSVNGKKVASLKINQGSAVIPASIASGSYLLKITSDSETLSRKCILQ